MDIRQCDWDRSTTNRKSFVPNRHAPASIRDHNVTTFKAWHPASPNMAMPPAYRVIIVKEIARDGRGPKGKWEIPEKNMMRCVTAVVVVLGSILTSACDRKNTGETSPKPGAEPISVKCTPAQAAMWREFVRSMAEKKWPPMAIYTRRENPIRNLAEVTSKDQFAICKLYQDYSGFMMRMFGYDPKDLVGLRVCGGHPDTLNDQKLRLYLAFEEWDKTLSDIGWVPVELAP